VTNVLTRRFLAIVALLAVMAVLTCREVDWKTTPTSEAVEENNVDAVANRINECIKGQREDVARGWDSESTISAKRNVQIAVCLHKAMAWRDPIAAARLADAIQDVASDYVETLAQSKVIFDPKLPVSSSPWLSAVFICIFQSRATRIEKSLGVMRSCIAAGAGNYALLNAYDYMPDDKLYAYIRNFEFTKRDERYQLENITEVARVSKMTVDDIAKLYDDKATSFTHEKIKTIEFNGVVHMFVRNLRKAGVDELTLVQKLANDYRADAPVTARYARMAILAYILNAESVQDGKHEELREIRNKIADIVKADKELNVGFLGDMIK